MPRRALVACIGNSLVADDGAGCAVYEHLASASLPPGVRLAALGLGGMALLDCLEGEPLLVVVDAVELGASPGTVHVLEDLPAARGAAVSAHGIGVREALDAGRILNPGLLPRRVLLVGIEGRCFDTLGGPMSPEVAAAVPRAAAAVLQAIGTPLGIQAQGGSL